MKVLYSVLFFVFISCNMPGIKPAAVDSTNGLSEEAFEAKYKDSFTRKINEDIMLDTVGIAGAAIKVQSAKLVKEEYSSYRNIEITYKNVSQKKVDAIKFHWYGLTAFGQPADMGGSFAEGFGGGFVDDPIGAGKSQTRTFDVLSRNGKKLILVWPVEIVFADGSKWESKRR